MNKIFEDLLAPYNGNLSYVDVEDSCEGELHSISVHYIDTLKFNQSEYEEWENWLEGNNVIGNHFQIYGSYDQSGFGYWNIKQEESNYTFIDVWFSDDFSQDDIPAFQKAFKEFEQELYLKFHNC